MTKRTRYSAEFKAHVALDAIREELTLAGLSKKCGAVVLALATDAGLKCKTLC